MISRLVLGVILAITIGTATVTPTLFIQQVQAQEEEQSQTSVQHTAKGHESHQVGG